MSINGKIASSSRLPFFRIMLWGPFCVEKRVGETYEAVKTADWGGSNYPRLLLKALLCCPGRRGRREALLDMLWPEIEVEQATANLNTATTKLRSFLRPAKGHESLLLTEDDSTIYQLPDQEILWVDSEAAHQALERADHLGRTSAEFLPLLEEAITLTNRGTFLEGEEDQWTAERRATHERERYRGRIWLAETYQQHRRVGRAETILTTLLEDDPFDEDVLCRLMMLLQDQGMAHQARLLYQRIQEYFSQALMDFTDATKNVAASLEQRRSTPSMTFSYPNNLSLFPPHSRFSTLQEGLSSLKFTVSPQSMLPDRHANDEIQTLFLSQMSRRSDIAMMSVELQMPLQTMLAELDAIADKLSHEQYQFSRRQILSALAALPLAMLTLDSSSSSTYARDLFLPQCATSLVACNHLMKSQNFWYVKHILTHLIPALVQTIQRSSLQREGAAHLLTQCYLLLGILESHQLNWSAYESLNEQAVQMSLLTSDTSLQVIAHVQLAMAFFQFEKPSQALSLYHKIAPQALQGSPLVQSDLHIKQALAYAQAGQATEMHRCIDQAYAHFPTQPENDPSSLFTDFGAPSLLSWHATAEFKLAQQRLGTFRTVWTTLSQADRLPPQSSAKVLVYVQTLQAETALALKDLEMFSHFLTAGIIGAKQLRSARRFQEAVDCYRLAKERWPNEARLQPLADMIIGKKQEAKDDVI